MARIFGISFTGLGIAFTIHVLWGLAAHAGSSEPYPILIQTLIVLFAFGAPIIALPIAIYSDLQRS